VLISKRLKNNEKSLLPSKFVVSKPNGVNPIKPRKFKISVQSYQSFKLTLIGFYLTACQYF